VKAFPQLYTDESQLIELGLLEFTILNQNNILIALSTLFMVVGPSFTSPNHRSVNYIHTFGNSGILK